MRNEPIEELVIGNLLERRARSHRTDTFLQFREGELSYGEVDHLTNRVATGLAALGVRRGDHVAVMLPNCPELLYTVFALSKLGAVAVPLNTELCGNLLHRALADAHAAYLVIDAPLAEELSTLTPRLPRLGGLVVRTPDSSQVPLTLGKPAVSWDSLLSAGSEPPRADVAFCDLQAIMYTSGTTGPSKGVLVSHALALTCALDSLDYLDRWGKTAYCPLPLFHAAGLWDGVLSAMLSGATIAIADRFHVSRFWDDVRYFDAKVGLGVFSMIPMLLNQEPTEWDTLHPLEVFYMGKSALDARLHERFGVRSVECYTSTEVGIATGSPYPRWRHGSCGQANDERFQLDVVDELDRPVGPGEPGELVVRTRQPYVITGGYYNDPEATVHSFRNMWFHTGDRVWRDADGYFYFLDRMKDAIRRRGENISAFDLECEVNLHPAVLECAAYGVPSELEDEDVKLAVVPRKGASLDTAEVLDFCRKRLPRYMVPRYVEFLDELPRTATDKIAKHRLRAETPGPDGHPAGLHRVPTRGGHR
ncbi:AMP-binding protein [Amycolatopsis aidingensis]|uniref:AMP-binding protein n=1 Tax=Amycolatopsis aidingensis TaxID=2842453 RepID=UPI001C0D3374|nr:AMP-binding protein [Amycolatopsis aidingensis]